MPSTDSREFAPRSPEGDAVNFSLLDQDPLYRAQRVAHLIPSRGHGIVRRVIVVVLVAWLPLVLWALLHRRAFPEAGIEPLLQHFGVHARFLIAIPLLLLAEPLAQAVGRRIVSYFLSSGLVLAADRPSFIGIIEGCRALLRSRVALLVIVVLAFGNAAVASRDVIHLHEVYWGLLGTGSEQRLGFAAWWYLWVSRPLYAVLLFSWIWRLVVTVILLWRISRLDLQLVPTHPDGCGGLGFLQTLPTAFAPVILAASTVLAARWGHDVLYHALPVESLRVSMGLFVVLVLLLFLAPLLVFVPKLAALRRQSLLAYGALVGRHGHLVEQRWIRGEAVEDRGLLAAPELGPVADTLTLYEAVVRMRAAPIGKQSIITVAAAAIVPMLPVVAIQVPIKDQLLSMIKILL
ncbi:MAG: hypothetical protein ACREKS_07600 [Candidatus Rokuibacteriota bacterium]